MEPLKRPESLLPFALFQRGIHSGKPLVWFRRIFFLVRKWLQSTPTLQDWSLLRSCGYSWEIGITRLDGLGSHPKRRSCQTSCSGALHTQIRVGCARKFILHFCNNLSLSAHSLLLSLTGRGENTELESLVQGQRGDQRDVTLWSQPENHIHCHTAHNSSHVLLVLGLFQWWVS